MEGKRETLSHKQTESEREREGEAVPCSAHTHGEPHSVWAEGIQTGITWTHGHTCPITSSYLPASLSHAHIHHTYTHTYTNTHTRKHTHTHTHTHTCANTH